MADALDVPVSVSETASEGGAWGIALLALYRSLVEAGMTETLPEFLNNQVFSGGDSVQVEPRPEEVREFNKFMESYRAGLPVARAAGESF